MDICYCSKFNKCFFAISYLTFLSGFIISACSPEKRNNRETGKEKQEYYFLRQMKCFFEIITATIKSDFQRYTNKKKKKKKKKRKIKKNANENNLFGERSKNRS